MRLTPSSKACVVALAAVWLAACNPAERAKQAKDEVDSGNAAACAEERSLVERAVQAYTLLEPDAPITEAAIVTAGYLHQQSVLMDVGSDGTVVAAPGTVCA
jgi:hypothetical protein